jgi:hypothetical protein
VQGLYIGISASGRLIISITNVHLFKFYSMKFEQNGLSNCDDPFGLQQHQGRATILTTEVSVI